MHELFILAGEPSGDLIAADLMSALNSRASVRFQGVGGPAMTEQGLDPYFDMSELMVMGFADVIQQLPRLLKKVRTTADHIIARQPDMVILVDYQDFSTLLAKRLRKLGFNRPIVLYVAPSVWAWRPGRARKIRGVFDEVLALFPFEPELMTALGGPKTSYVGHPAVKRTKPVDSPRKGLLMLLPGSRRGEIHRHMKLFRRVAQTVNEHSAVTGVVLPTLKRLEAHVQKELADWPFEVEVSVDPDNLDNLYENTTVALASSGTVTLELALRGVPFVGTYVPDALQAAAYLVAGRPRILLPNVIAGREIVAEQLYGPGMVRRVTSAMLALLEQPQLREAQLQALAEVRSLMEYGSRSAKKEDAADRILSHLGAI